MKSFMSKMKMDLVAVWFLVAILMLFYVTGCATSKAGTVASTVSTVAATAPELAKQFDNVYAFLVQQKLVPDHMDAATKALAAMDAVAPLVQKGASALTGDNFNWAQFVLQSALTVAQILGYVIPLLA
jgi:hypothetical protein